MVRDVRRAGCRWILVGILLLGAGILSPVRAQQQDTTQTPDRVPRSDTVRTARPDTLRSASQQPDTTQADTTQARRPRPSRGNGQQPALTPAPFGRPTYGSPAVDSLPARLGITDLKQVLAEQPGSFLYDLGAVAWPHGWSTDGLAPHRSRLWLGDLPYTDPLTGRPRADLLPTTFLQRPGLGVDPAGSPTGVHVDWRDYDARRPLTELRFRRDSNGLQNVEVSHSQQRRLALLGIDGVLQVTAGFQGRATGGVYNGSDLRKQRGLWGRLRYRTRNWIVELTDFSNRFRLSVHGGITPPVAGQLASIYPLPAAETAARFQGARQNTIRNDLVARVRGPVTPLPRPMQLSLGWTANTYDYQTAYSSTVPAYPDTSWSLRTNSVHAAVTQPLRLGRHVLTATGRGTVHQRRRGTARSGDDAPVWSVHAALRDSFGVAGTSVVLDGGLHQTDAQTYPSARVQVQRPFGPADVRVLASLDGQPLPWVMRRGFAGFVVPVDEASDAAPNGPTAGVPSGQVRRVEGRLRVTAGVADAALTGFAHQITDPVDLYAGTLNGQALGVDTVAVRAAPGSFLRAGATLSAGLRRDARRGLYATGHVTALEFLNPTDSPLHRRVAETLPPLFGRGRIGARFILFEDFVTDLSVQVRAWTATNSRLFHPPTGLMAVPPLQEPIRGFPGERVGPSYTVDAQASAILRGAKLFFSFENVQSAQIIPIGSRPQLGTFVTPIYPLPPLQFRFGVHWPIFD